jgi:hypothetical protein
LNGFASIKRRYMFKDAGADWAAQDIQKESSA